MQQGGIAAAGIAPFAPFAPWAAVATASIATGTYQTMNDMLDQRGQSAEVDPQGSLVDADMALYYAWLAMERQPGGEQASLLAWVEGHGEVFLAGPRVTRGVESASPVTMQQAWAML